MSRTASSRARQPRGVPVGGQFAASAKPEVDVALLDPSLDPDFDPHALAAHHTEHDLAERGIVTISLPDGRKTAWNVNGPDLACPACLGEPDKQANCADCFGRGTTQNIPFCERPWDEAMPGLFVGGHDSQTGDCQPGDQFDVVVSLAQRPGFEPDEGVEHHTHTMIDGPLDPADYAHLHRLADATVTAVQRGDKVLVRCMAGMNRSGLVTAMAMMRMGWSAQDAIDKMRADRGPYVLFNGDFRAFVLDNEATIRAGDVVCSGCRGRGGDTGGPCWDCQGRGGQPVRGDASTK